MRRFLHSGAIARTMYFIVLFAGVIGVQARYDAQQVPRDQYVDASLPAPVMRNIDFGLHSAVASLLWLNVIQDLLSVGPAHGLSGTIERINAIDPQFAYPYAFGELVIPMFNASDTPAAIAIGTRGVALHLPDWKIPYYLAVTYSVGLKDKANAAIYYDVAAHTPGIPDGIREYSLSHNTLSSDVAPTRQMWVSVYENSRDEIVQDQAQAQIAHIDVVALLNQAIMVYKKAHGHAPAAIQDLVTSGILKEMPEDPLGVTYEIDAHGSLTALVQ